MEKHLFLGDEAVAQAAIDAGLSGVYAYPGTPSTEITEFIQGSAVAKERGIHCRWSTNEKTAMEAALGMSYAGKRALCCMKHVGLNVAADCFMNAAMSGVNGGMIIITADDPSMHSSQNEQDNRMYGNFAMIPMLEPASQQEAYDMVYDGFELSEKLGYPVLVRITTRMAHSRAGVVRREQKVENKMLLETAFGILGEEEITIVVLHMINGLKHREIAELTGLTLSTVLSKYNRSLKKMKSIIE